MIDFKAIGKKILPLVIACAVGAVATFILCRVRVPVETAHVTVTNFYTISNVMPVYDYIPATSSDPCLAIVRRYNNLLDSYKLFLGSQPRYLSNFTSQCIDFALASNSYRMCVRVDAPVERPYWSVGAVYMMTGGIGVTAGVGWYIVDIRAILTTGLPAAWKPDIGGGIAVRMPL